MISSRARTSPAPRRSAGWRGAALLLALVAPLAFAGLGEAPSEMAASATQRTAAATSAGVAYTDIQRTLKSGTVVHQYVDANGIVFAVSWAGPFKPDLKRLLGRHFDRVVEGGATAARRGERSRLDVNDTDLVLRSGGHMGAFEGSAWVPSRLPAGFDPQEMK